MHVYTCIHVYTCSYNKNVKRKEKHTQKYLHDFSAAAPDLLILVWIIIIIEPIPVHPSSFKPITMNRLQT